MPISRSTILSPAGPLRRMNRPCQMLAACTRWRSSKPRVRRNSLAPRGSTATPWAGRPGQRCCRRGVDQDGRHAVVRLGMHAACRRLRNIGQEWAGGSMDKHGIVVLVVQRHADQRASQGLYTLFGFDRVMYLNRSLFALSNESAKDKRSAASRQRCNPCGCVCS